MTSRTSLASAIALVLALASCSADDGNGGDGSGTDPSGNATDGSGATSGGSGSAGSGTGTSGGSAGSGSGIVPNYVPMFPGAGTAADSGPLPGGMVCDSVPGATIESVSQVTRCFFGPDDRVNPRATIEQVLECVEDMTVLHLRLTFDPAFNDNTYGANSIGWSPKRGHRFGDLVSSDHAELVLVDGNGEIAMQFKMDYISEDPSVPSGYSALGVLGGDGSISIGSADHVLDWSTSLHKNFNERGYSSYTVDSPATDENYTPNPDAPEWDYRMVFDVWIDLDAFGDAGFSGAFIDYVHASPSKAPSDTIETTPGECPPCTPDAPDESCIPSPPGDGGSGGSGGSGGEAGTGTGGSGGSGGEAGTGTGGSGGSGGEAGTGTGGSGGSGGTDPQDPAYCMLYPTDPACTVE